MINEIRNTVLYFISKDGRGYLTPAEYNSFAEMAQRSVFEGDFFLYNKLVLQQAGRLTTSEFGDLPKNLRERIDRFSQYATLTKTSGIWSYSATDVHRAEGLTYNGNTDIEEVSKLDINKLNNTPLVSNSTTYPVYTRIGKDFKIFPDSITSNVQLYYLRTPVSPKWTYIDVDGNPLFNPTASDYKDFDMHESCFEPLVAKILSYAGISINSQEITSYVDTQTQLEMAKQR